MAQPKVKVADQELIKRGIDFEVFCEEILGVRLNPAQKRVVRRLKVGPDHQWGFKTAHVVAANQIGKTLITGCLILWACTYKIGVDALDTENEEDIKRWLDESYLWINLGPVQQQSYHAYKDIRRLIKNEHPAQEGRGKFPTEMVEPTKVEKYYDGFVFWNGAEAHFRTAEDKAEAVLGYRAAGITFDEAAFEDHLTEVVNTVLYMRLIAMKGPLFLISTPNGMNDFFDFVDEVKTEGDRVEDMVWVYRDKWLVWATIVDNEGYGISHEEIERMEETIGSATKEQQLRGAFLEPAEAFFVPQQKILDVFDSEMPHETAPIPGHDYVEFWDPSISSDPTVVIVLDVTERPFQGVYWHWYDKPLDVTQLVGEMHRVHLYYNGFRDVRNPLSPPTTSVMGFDATSLGGAIMNQLLAPLRPKRPVNFGGNATKLPALINLRSLLTKGDVVLPGSWVRVRSELLNYRLKDDKIQQDNVMALVGASIVAGGAHRKSVKADVSARVTKKRRLVWEI